MLETLDGKEYKKPPRAETFAKLDLLNPIELQAAKAALNMKIEGSEVHTAGWMPGADWTGTVFQPIYDKAAHKDFNLAAKIFGLLVFQVFIERPETWYFLRAEKDGETLQSLTYFRPEN